MTRPDLTLAREYEAALAWWQAAGVDCDFCDDATAWLAETPLAEPPQQPARGASPASGGALLAPRRAAASPAPEVPARRDLLGESPPADLGAFREWWMSAPGLDFARGYPRIAPRGKAGAQLMVLVPQPEEGDRERLLEGPQGRLLGNIFKAIGLEEGDIYLAAVLPGHTPLADLPALAAEGMDAVTLHHIALAAPRRLLVLGTALAPMLGTESADGLREINHGGGKVPAMASETLEAMLHMPRLKARFWRRWMEWSASH
ncbi:MAG: hypothetical protein GC147_01185 [Porphyrobacter sp.]|nr:hypothetical protein [Porphyrobacter sp.]